MADERPPAAHEHDDTCYIDGCRNSKPERPPVGPLREAKARGWLQHNPDCSWNVRMEDGTKSCDCGLLVALAAPERPPVDPLREAAQEVDAAFAAKPDVDENDHPEGLSKERVERAWVLWDVRQQKALAALRAALASPAAPRPEGLTDNECRDGGCKYAVVRHAHVTANVVTAFDLASPAACICGKPAPMAGTCFDIDGDFWPGHGSAPPAAPLDPVDPLREAIHAHPDGCAGLSHPSWRPQDGYKCERLAALASPAAPRPEGLDAERLARAITNIDFAANLDASGTQTIPDHARRKAERYGREYQRLSDTGDT